MKGGENVADFEKIFKENQGFIYKYLIKLCGNPSLAIVPLILFIGIALYPFTKITVVKSLPSPEGTYYAEVTDVDTGALGGDTCVHIHKTKKLGFTAFQHIKNTPTGLFGRVESIRNNADSMV